MNSELARTWFIKRLDTDGCVFVYATMYGGVYTSDEIMMLQIFQLTKDKDGFYYRWGGPGPDINRYLFKDYGKTWAFRMEDFNCKGDTDADSD